MYTVKRLSELAGVTVRTLHYYDEIDLLKPTRTTAKGYRHYDDSALLRLQQILFYREIGLELLEIKAILDHPDFDVVAALRSHREVLQGRIHRLENLINTVDDTISHLTKGTEMSNKRLFKAFTDEEQAYYTRLARLEYGPDLVNESVNRWKSYTADKQAAIMEEAGGIYSELAQALAAGVSAQDEQVQAILERWHQNLRYFYEPTLEILRGLGHLYRDNPDFATNFEQLHPDLPAYLTEAITQYVDDLEYAVIAHMLSLDEDDDGNANKHGG